MPHKYQNTLVEFLQQTVVEIRARSLGEFNSLLFDNMARLSSKHPELVDYVKPLLSALDDVIDPKKYPEHKVELVRQLILDQSEDIVVYALKLAAPMLAADAPFDAGQGEDGGGISAPVGASNREEKHEYQDPYQYFRASSKKMKKEISSGLSAAQTKQIEERELAHLKSEVYIDYTSTKIEIRLAFEDFFRVFSVRSGGLENYRILGNLLSDITQSLISKPNIRDNLEQLSYTCHVMASVTKFAILHEELRGNAAHFTIDLSNCELVFINEASMSYLDRGTFPMRDVVKTIGLIHGAAASIVNLKSRDELTWIGVEKAIKSAGLEKQEVENLVPVLLKLLFRTKVRMENDQLDPEVFFECMLINASKIMAIVYNIEDLTEKCQH